MSQRAPLGSPDSSRYLEIAALHQHCGVYTKPEVVSRILDAVGWKADVDLSKSRLLEPAAGDGVFIIEAARRVVASFTNQGVELKMATLEGRIKAFELHPREAQRARAGVVEVLQELGIHHVTARQCARTWVVNSDFLLAKTTANSFSHVVGNPPYVRWSRIPKKLRARYERRLAPSTIGGDLFVPFLHRAFELMQNGGRCGFLCSDRWRYMAFADGFRKAWLPRVDIHSEVVLPASDAFTKRVDSYPSILIASKRTAPRSITNASKQEPLGRTLGELGCVIRVGPALGHSPAFLLDAHEHDVERELLRPWIDGSEISEGLLDWRGRRVVIMNREDGQLIDPDAYPLLKVRLERHQRVLKKRAIARAGGVWFRPIDRVRAKDWERPKLLVPELAKVPRVAIDTSGAIPSHGVYAIFVENDEIGRLYERLANGRLAKALEGIAPRVNGGYVRCYRRFLSMIRVDD